MEEAKSREVVDISSDSESGSGVVDFKWIRKLLEEEEEEEEGVVVVVGSDDDDCVVLDGDPDAYKAVSEPEPDDDLLLVAAKGQVACRDFPHPRHLCAKFPFSSSRHEMNCDQCHCYVCDSLAPCVYWGTGVSSFDHCHATDKEEFWKSQRSSLRNVKVSVPMPVPPVHHIAISMTGPPMANQLSPLVPNQLQQNQVPRQFTVRSCSTPTNTLVPNVTRQGSHPGSVLPRSKYRTHLISPPPAHTSPLVSLTDRRHNNCNLGPQRAIFKRTVPAGFALASDTSGLNPSCLNYGPLLPTNPPVMPMSHGSHGGITSGSHAYQSSDLANIGGIADMLSPQTDPVLANTMPPPQMLSQKSSGNGNDILWQPQFASRQHINSGFTNYRLQTFSHFPVNGVSENSLPPQQLVSSHMPRNGNFRASFVSGTQTCYQPDLGYGLMNKTPTPHQLTCLTQQNEGRNTEFSEAARTESCRQIEADTESLQFPLTNARSSSILNSHGSMQQGNQTIPESLPSNGAVSDFRPVTCTTQSRELSGYNSQLQNAEQADHYSANKSSYHEHASLSNFGTTDLEAWLLVDHSIPQSLGISVPLLNTPIPSPELASLDGGGLFVD